MDALLYLLLQNSYRIIVLLQPLLLQPKLFDPMLILSFYKQTYYPITLLHPQDPPDNFKNSKAF